MIVAVIGLGLIGGSIALELKANGFADKIIGVDSNKDNSSMALELGIVDEINDLDFSVNIADLVIVSIPVNSIIKILPTILDKAGIKTIITDMGSTKEGISGIVKNHVNRANFVASHPIAGTEHSGPKAAHLGLFVNKTAIICDREKSSEFALSVVEAMYKVLKMRLIDMDSASHDLHIAYVSHLSHISSFALGITVLDKEKDENTIFNLAGSGFESTVRLAKSSPAMWTPIFQQNAKNVSDALDEYIKNLQVFKNYIDNNQPDEAFELMHTANEIRRVLDGIKK